MISFAAIQREIEMARKIEKARKMEIGRKMEMRREMEIERRYREGGDGDSRGKFEKEIYRNVYIE